MLGREAATKHYAAPLPADYQDLQRLCDFANLALEFTDEQIGLDRLTGKPLVGLPKAPRKTWRSPAFFDDAERDAFLKRFAGRLRRKFPPRKGFAATLRLSDDRTFDIETIEEAWRLAGIVGLAWGRIKIQCEVGKLPPNRGNIPPGNMFLIGGEEPQQIRINYARDRKGQSGPVLLPAPDFFHDVLLPALFGRDPRRLRECPICLRPFLARRYDQQACTRRCANHLRIIRFRGKQARQYRHQLKAVHRKLNGGKETRRP